MQHPGTLILVLHSEICKRDLQGSHCVRSGCLQVLASVNETEPLTRRASFRTIATQPGRVELLDNTESREPLCAQHAGGVAQPRSKDHLAAQLRSLLGQARSRTPASAMPRPCRT